ncbi:MAG: alpha/beta hydrolase [Acidobacteriota bacterium]|nr:alpha/beta hydrolase [Acidobacteriota bacterium]MXZ37551.1 alpha/beta hydrolase [Holophagales bacterium]MYF03522.1 alpha/beta hydrolase [Holophagales bacterium]MYJ24010.1 alpha/beta hydrolase [Holophagales bacterium]
MTVWKVPEPLALDEVRLDEETVTTVRRHGRPDAPLRLVLSHGNGLAIDAYYPFWSLLADEFDLVVYDVRSHGWNSVGEQTSHNIPTMIHDHDVLAGAIAERYGDKPTVGVFHSLTTIVAILSFSDPYSALVLFDPPFCKPAASETEFDDAADRATALTRRRASYFQSEEEFSDLLRYSPVYARVLPGVRELVAATTLRLAEDGEGRELRCPREFEAQVSEYVRSFAPLLDLSLLSCPTKVIGADPTLPYAYLPSFDLAHIRNVDYDFIADSSHFLQLEKPAECVAMLRAFLRQTGLLGGSTQ